MILGIDRKGNIWQVSDTINLLHAYERLERTNFSSILGILKTYPAFLLNALTSSNAGGSWSLVVYDYDGPFQQDWQYIAGVTRKGQVLFSQDKGSTWTFYENPRSSKYFQYKWIVAIPKPFTVNNSLTSLNYGNTWISTSAIKSAFLSVFIGAIWAQITRAEVRVGKPSELPLPEELFELMLSFLPKYERSSVFFREVISVHAKEVYKLFSLLDDLQKQLFIATSSWGLDLWEEFLGLPKATGSDEERRTKILHKLFSNVFATRKNIEELASYITGKEVKIVEDFRNQVVVVKDYLGDIPQDSLYLYTRIREVLPAQLGVVFEYRMWNFVERRYTWDEWDAKSLTWDKYEEVDEEWLSIRQD